jgi:hypothetical protein
MEVGLNYFFISSVFAGSYSLFYIVMRNMKNVIFDNYREVDALKIKVDRLIYCQEKLITKLIAIEEKLNVNTSEKEVSTEDLTLLSVDDRVENEIEVKDVFKPNTVHIDDAYENLDCMPIMPIIKSKSWLQKMYL